MRPDRGTPPLAATGSKGGIPCQCAAPRARPARTGPGALRPGPAQAAALAQPDVGAQLLLQLLHAVAERRLGQVEDAGSGGQRALLLDLLHDAEVDPLQHDDESRSWIGEVIPFYVMEGHG
ncbi:hypothetical protein G6F68_015835 [Rhizopus microsporus]|nr:hypothetical protein G6F68_015835 [Rhizopus microsporus]